MKSSPTVVTMVMWIHLGIFLFVGFCSTQMCNGEHHDDIGTMLKCTCGCQQDITEDSEIQNLTCSELREHQGQKMAAFQSFLTKNLGNVPNGTVIAFDQVLLNTGDAYNPNNGIFTAQNPGTYIFSMSLSNPAGNPGTLFMVQSNGNESVILGWTNVGNTTDWSMNSVSTITYLNEGDTVQVEGEGSIHGPGQPTNVSENHSPRRYTTFSGTILH